MIDKDHEFKSEDENSQSKCGKTILRDVLYQVLISFKPTSPVARLNQSVICFCCSFNLNLFLILLL